LNSFFFFIENILEIDQTQEKDTEEVKTVMTEKEIILMTNILEGPEVEVEAILP
jgi:hypothetical protein